MGTFGWKAPFPLKFGGRPGARIDAFYRSMQNGRVTALNGGEGTEVDIENKTAARLLGVAARETARRVNQRDPLKLSAMQRPVKDPETGITELISPLERAERIFGIHVVPGASLRSRRLAVKAKVVSYTSTTLEQVSLAMGGVFGSWLKGVFESDISDVHYAGKVPPGNIHAYWATNAFTFSADYPGEYDATKPWRTGLAVINVGFLPPANTSQDLIDDLRSKALMTLDDMLPAWMSAVLSQWGQGQTSSGFFLGISHLGLTAL